MRQKHEIQEFNGVRFYVKPGGYYKADHIKMGRKCVLMHRYVWEYFHGAIPPGHHVHHRDGDKSNNAIENLECLPGGEHISHHTREKAVREPGWWNAGLELAREAARHWHSSDEGRRWHSEHGVRVWVGRELREHQCAHCGKVYAALRGAVKRGRGFCSNACKSYARIASGVDNEARRCCICGGEFVCNRYAKRKTCGKACAGKAIARSRQGVRPDGAT